MKSHPSFFHMLAVSTLAALLVFAVGCSSSDDDGDSSATPTSGDTSGDASGTSPAGEDAGSDTDGESDGDADAPVDPDARPGLAKIQVCDFAGGLVTVSVNGDTLENNKVEAGGTLFINTVLGPVTYAATDASGVATFAPVTMMMVAAEGENAQTVNLECTAVR